MLSNEQIEQFFSRNVGALFFTKHRDWSYEIEFRVIMLGVCREKVIVDIRDALQAIVFHPSMNNPLKRKIYETLACELNPDIQVNTAAHRPYFDAASGSCPAVSSSIGTTDSQHFQIDAIDDVEEMQRTRILLANNLVAAFLDEVRDLACRNDYLFSQRASSSPMNGYQVGTKTKCQVEALVWEGTINFAVAPSTNGGVSVAFRISFHGPTGLWWANEHDDVTPSDEGCADVLDLHRNEGDSRLLEFF